MMHAAREGRGRTQRRNTKLKEVRGGTTEQPKGTTLFHGLQLLRRKKIATTQRTLSSSSLAAAAASRAPRGPFSTRADALSALLVRSRAR
mmetsp:Transcript_28267/g.86653  ORF Transcript_28267/g.86653 Transcript_28267/m.86653 type:complete len:90 (+) Transcript_28267:911-1180(+)